MKSSLIIENRELFDKVKFRTKFEVTLAEWNPKINLIALGSREGDVIVKRYLWKTGWKRNFSREQPFKRYITLIDGVEEPHSSKATDDQLVHLQWSPDGQILLVAFQSGRAYYLDTQTGNPLYYKKFAYSPANIQWIRHERSKSKTDVNYPRASEQTMKMIAATDLNSIGNAPEHADVCLNVEYFYDHFLHKSISSTFLCVIFTKDNTLFVDVFANGILLLRRVNIGTTLCLPNLDCSTFQAIQKQFYIKMDKLHLVIKNENSPTLLQFPQLYGRNHLRIHNQLVDCIGWMSFCCIYLQEAFHSSIQNWQQSSEVFHQRLFAAVNNHSISPLDLCRDLLVMLKENKEPTSLVEKFLDYPLTQKELKQSRTFLEEFTHLINGIASGLQLAARALRATIHLLRSLLIKLTKLRRFEGERVDQADRLLDTLLKIASGHAKFEESLDQNYEQILTEFEHSVLSLEVKLQNVIDLAENNRNELQNLLNWFGTLLFDSRNNCSNSALDNFDAILIITFLTEVIANEGFFEGEKYALDRMISHLGCDQLEMKFDSASAENNSTIWGHIQICLQHFRNINKDGLNLLAPSPTNCDQYIILSDADNVEMETGSGQDEDDDDEIDGDGPARGGKQSFSLHSFIFGCPDPSADEEEEEEQDGRMEEDQ